MVYQDVIRPSKDVRTYRVNFLLWKEQWDAYTAPPIPLNWKCVKFEENSAAQIPKSLLLIGQIWTEWKEPEDFSRR